MKKQVVSIIISVCFLLSPLVATAKQGKGKGPKPNGRSYERADENARFQRGEGRHPGKGKRAVKRRGDVAENDGEEVKKKKKKDGGKKKDRDRERQKKRKKKKARDDRADNKVPAESPNTDSSDIEEKDD